MYKNVFEVFEQLEQESSTIRKQNILSKNADNPKLTTLLQYAYNPYIQFYIKKLPNIEMSTESSYEDNYNLFIEMLEKLSHRNITGNDALSYVSKVFSHFTKTEVKWYSRVLQKDLDIGIAEKSINKAIPKLIPVYNVMLADKIPSPDLELTTPKALKLLPDRMVVQYKIDGYRLNIHRPDKDTLVIRTRNGKVVTGYNDLEKSALQLPVGYVYDGELVAPELFNWIQKNTQYGGLSSANRDLFNEVMSHAFSKEDDKKGIFNIFDMVPISEWISTNSITPYSQRLKYLENLQKIDNIVVVPTSRVYYKSRSEDLKEIVDTFHNFIKLGWEGLMIKDYDAFYQWKRTKSMLKMKLMDTMDLVVTGIYKGTGKYLDMMGGVYCFYKGNKLAVGSGFTDDQRTYFYDNPNSIIGKTIEIAYQAITHNKQGGTSVSFPVFKGIRNDK